MSISVVINTLNEEANIARAIASVKKLADEIVVVDMESEDKTVKIAKKLGAKVYSHKKTHYVEPARNFAVAKASGDWIFILDADEEAPHELVDKLLEIAKNDTADFVRVPRKNLIFGKWMKHSRWWPDQNIRFFKKGFVTWDDAIHSIPVTDGRHFDLPFLEEFALIHHHYETIEQYVDRLNRYTTIQAKELIARDRKFSYKDLIHRPTAEFLSRFFAGEGYKDGVHGLCVALLQGLSEAVVYAKLWQYSGFKEEHLPLKDVLSELTLAQKETNYWKAHSQVQNGAGVAARVRRKFKLQ